MSSSRTTSGVGMVAASLVMLLTSCTTRTSAPPTKDHRNARTTTTTTTTINRVGAAPTAPPTTTTAGVGGLRAGRALRSVVPARCTLIGAGGWTLPDPTCTPGALNPAVRPATVATTICVPGYSTRIRPAESFTYDLKRSQMAAWGLSGSTAETEEDHLVPLSLGGAPSDSANLWPEPGGIPNLKDRLEYRLYRMVCDGQIGLRAAQQAIASNWITAYQRFVGPTPGS